ncbi:MAG: FecR domain-containing protein [Alistipes sp.]|nr:FecR domain-containing protein [Alistipes sp.]
MKRQHIDNSKDINSATTEARAVEWMIAQLLSDDRLLPERTMELIRHHLADESNTADRQLKREMDLMFLAAFQAGRRGAEDSGAGSGSAGQSDAGSGGGLRSPLVEEMWPRIAATLGMNPDLNHYRNAQGPAVSPPGDRGAISQNKRAASGNRDKVSGGLDTVSGVRDTARKVLSPRRLSRKWIFPRAAAVILPAAMALGVGGYFGWRALQGGARETTPAVFAATTSVRASTDSIRHITLADGTRVTLNRSSTFAYNDHREGELTGEAYFRIAPDAEHPFVIHSERLTVTVLGTEFNMNTRTPEDRSTLSLYEGTVELSYDTGGDTATRRLGEAGRQFTLDHATDMVDIRDFDIAVEPDWITAEELLQRQLINIIPLGEIFDLVEAEYGVEIENRAAVDLTGRYNFMHDSGASPDDVMRALQFAGAGFEYRMEGGTIILE